MLISYISYIPYPLSNTRTIICFIPSLSNACIHTPRRCEWSSWPDHQGCGDEQAFRSSQVLPPSPLLSNCPISPTSIYCCYRFSPTATTHTTTHSITQNITHSITQTIKHNITYTLSHHHPHYHNISPSHHHILSHHLTYHTITPSSPLRDEGDHDHDHLHRSFPPPHCTHPPSPSRIATGARGGRAGASSLADVSCTLSCLTQRFEVRC